MAKISELPDVPAPDGTEDIPVVKDGVAKKTKLGAVISAIAQPFVDLAHNWAVAAATSAGLFGYFDRLGPVAHVAFEDASGNLLADITPTAIVHPQIIGLAANDVLGTAARETIVKDLIGIPRFPIADSAGNLLAEILADRIDHPQIMAFATAIAALQGKLTIYEDGDSLDAGFPGFPPPSSAVATALARTTSNSAIGGQGGLQIAKRWNAVPTTVRITGAQLVAGPNVVTHIDGQTIAYWQGLSTAAKTPALVLSTPGDTTARSSPIFIGGVRASLARTSIAGVEGYSITVDAGYAAELPIAIADDATITFDRDAMERAPKVIGLGRNDIPAPGVSGAFFVGSVDIDINPASATFGQALLTVTAVIYGAIGIGQVLTAVALDPGARIMSQISGAAGAAGVYRVSTIKPVAATRFISGTFGQAVANIRQAWSGLVARYGATVLLETITNGRNPASGLDESLVAGGSVDCYYAITWANWMLKAEFPNNVLPRREYLIQNAHAISTATGIALTSDDLADLANDMIPRSFRYNVGVDGLHFVAAIYANLGSGLIAPRITSKGL